MPKKPRPRKYRRKPFAKPIAKFVRRLEAECDGFDPQRYKFGTTDLSSQAALLHESLQAAVPLWHFELVQIQKRWPEGFDSHIQQRAKACADYLAENGDALMFKTKDKTAKAFNCLAEGIACAAFCPGGITAFGMHWEYKRVRVDLK